MVSEGLLGCDALFERARNWSTAAREPANGYGNRVSEPVEVSRTTYEEGGDATALYDAKREDQKTSMRV